MAQIIITLPNDVRLFQRYGAGSQLARTDKMLGKSSAIRIGRIEQLSYDHRDIDAVPYNVGVIAFYILLEEIRDENLVARMRRFSNLRVVS